MEWFSSYLEHRKHCTSIKGQQSSLLDCIVGIPPGSVLGLLLFSIYVDDLPAICADAHIQMYADDTVIYVHSKSKQQASLPLVKAMEKIADWLSYSCLSFSVS